MSFLNIAQQRYTTKAYAPGQPIDSETIQQLQEVLRLSPSSINGQPWKFVFVANEDVKKELAAASLFNSDKVLNASHVVVFAAIGSTGAFEQQIAQNLPQRAVDYYNQVLQPRGEAQVQAWMQRQVYISLGFFLAACASMGVDSTPMEGIQQDEYNRILKLDGYTTLFAVAIGHRDPADANQPSVTPKSRLPLTQVVETI